MQVLYLCRYFLYSHAPLHIFLLRHIYTTLSLTHDAVAHIHRTIDAEGLVDILINGVDLILDPEDGGYFFKNGLFEVFDDVVFELILNGSEVGVGEVISPMVKFIYSLSYGR